MKQTPNTSSAKLRTQSTLVTLTAANIRQKKVKLQDLTASSILLSKCATLDGIALPREGGQVERGRYSLDFHLPDRQGPNPEPHRGMPVHPDVLHQQRHELPIGVLPHHAGSVILPLPEVK